MASNTELLLQRYPFSSSFRFLPLTTTTTLSFSLLRPRSLPFPLKFHASFSFKSPTSTLRAFSDAEEDEEDDEEDDEEEDQDHDQDNVSADEYDDVLGEASDDEADVFSPHDGFKWQRVDKLCNEVREFGADLIDVDELASVYDFRIDKFQRQAILVFLRGFSVVVSAPTSSRKTLIAEAARRSRRCPIRSFASSGVQLLESELPFETFGDSNVGLLTGDSAVNKDAQVLIMTTEILRNMLYQSVGNVSSGSGLVNVDVIVLDEVHYLSDISRGTVWEEIVIYCPKEVQLICLSATVANPDELAGWIGQVFRLCC
ncbi:DEAD-box ATP-dependent RNA helicase ISE2, chloroplastic [Glycine soja]|nr:DEAD-box ATP-dependent RNA helicase ISE2, chloroplastic [Glycine soja]